jgi:hypothetical protein
MGRAAHAPAEGRRENSGRKRIVTDHPPTLEREIHALLARPHEQLPGRDSVEYTLTAGYAHALTLDAERLRAERRLRALIRSGEAERTALEAAGGELSRVEAELARFRALLAALRARAL